jgi:hypothetical protein
MDRLSSVVQVRTPRARTASIVVAVTLAGLLVAVARPVAVAAAPSADGTQRVVRVDVATGEQSVVSVGPGTYDTDPTWALDGLVLAYATDADGPYRVDVEPGAEPERSGGPSPSQLVIALPGQRVLATVTDPSGTSSDLNPSFAPDS